MHKPSHKRILFDRYAAIAAILAAAAYDYGIRIWILAAAAAACSVLTARICNFVCKKPLGTDNPDAGIFGLILLLMLPPTVPFSLLIMSCIFAIIIGSQMFGGKGNPVLPPAAAGYCFCMLNSRSLTVSFPAVKQILPLAIPESMKLTGGVSVLWNRSGRFSVSVMEWLTGLPCQPVGTGSVVLLAAVAVILILRGSAASWVTVPALIASVSCNLLVSNLQHPVSVVIGSLLTNQMLIAVLFLHADPDYAPQGAAGIVYGFAVGFASFFASRMMYVYDAPVLLAVLLSPLMILLRRLMTEYADESDSAAERGLAA